MPEDQCPAKVSVIIPTYNRSHLVCRAIESVLDQTYKNIEIIVVDDGSTDNTKEKITQRFGSKINYLYQENNGAPSARNLGFKLSTGAYINFLDSDDYFLPTNIEQKVRILENNSQIDWVYSDYYYKDLKTGELVTNKTIKKLRTDLKSRNDIFDLILFNGITHTDTVMLRRQCIVEVDGFDEDLPSFQDTDLFYRIAKKFKCEFIDQPLAVQVPQDISISRNRDDYYEGKMMLIEKVKKLLPDDAKRLGYPTSKLVAEIHNYKGERYLNQKENKKAAIEFLKSIKAHFWQKEVYSLLFRSFFRKP